MSEKRAVIFVNGHLPNPAGLRSLLRSDDLLIAADGGLRFLRALGLKPHLVIGDLDSLAAGELQALRQEQVEVRQYPVHKDETDLELALQAALEAGVRQIWMVAALGGRLDMTLANIFLLLRPDLAPLDVRLEDGDETVLLVRPGQPAHIAGQIGQRLSLLALQGPANGISTQGLEYPLHNESLWPHSSRGLSNRLQADSARVSLESGLLLCIHRHVPDESQIA